MPPSLIGACRTSSSAGAWPPVRRWTSPSPPLARGLRHRAPLCSSWRPRSRPWPASSRSSAASWRSRRSAPHPRGRRSPVAGDPTGEDSLAGLPVFGPETLGRHSVLEQIALRLRQLGRHPRELQEALSLTDIELVVLHYDFEKSLRPVQRFPPVNWETDLTLGGRGA